MPLKKEFFYQLQKKEREREKKRKERKKGGIFTINYIAELFPFLYGVKTDLKFGKAHARTHTHTHTHTHTYTKLPFPTFLSWQNLGGRSLEKKIY